MTDKFDDNMEDFRDAFDCFEHEGSGMIRVAAIGEALTCLGYGAKEKELAQLIEEQVPLTTTELDFGQFISILATKMKSSFNKTELSYAFSVFDQDDDGIISCDDLRKIMKNLGDQIS